MHSSTACCQGLSEIRSAGRFQDCETLALSFMLWEVEKCPTLLAKGLQCNGQLDGEYPSDLLNPVLLSRPKSWSPRSRAGKAGGRELASM